MRTSAIVISGLAAVASATTTSWGYSTTTSSSSSSSYDPTWSGSWSTSTTAKAAVSTSSSYDPWSAWTSSTTTKAAVSTSYDPTWSAWSSSTTTEAAVSTSYDPTWSAWSSSSTASYDPTWTAWGSGSTAAAAETTPCPAWTGGTAPPAYYTNLPDSVKSALPSWTGAPPSDYCYYTSWMQSFSSCTAPAVVSPTTFASTGSYDPTWSAWSSAVKNTNLLFTAAQATGTASAYGSWTGTTG
jgi:chitinase